MADHHPPKESWSSRAGVILAVASCAIGLGNFLRFPGQAVQNGGGAFMIPYIISFLILGIPVCLSEWIMGRMGGKHGHSAPNIFRNFLSGFPLRIVSAIGIIIPILIYVYYVFIEAWCLSYAIDFITGGIDLNPAALSANSPGVTDEVVKKAGSHFISLVGLEQNGSAFYGKILFYTVLCYIMNFYLIYRGIAKGLETFAKIAIPLLLVCSIIVLVRVLTLDGIDRGLGKMWNPDWTALLKAEVWIAAAGQIFFSLSVGFGIVLIFSSYLTDKDDVTLSGLSAAALNEFVEVGMGGMITIPLGFMFLGASVATFGTFGMGFIALPAVFSLMPAGQIFGAVWFFLLFIAAITSSVTMLQPGITFIEEGFHIRRKYSVPIIFIFTFTLTLPIIYFSHDFAALDHTDFWVGTFLIYILATIQVIIYGWKIGAEKALEDGHKGAILKIPPLFNFIIKYITPSFLITIFIFFIYQKMPDYINGMNVDLARDMALNAGKPVEQAVEKASIARYVFLSIIAIFIFITYMVHISLKAREKEEAIK
ncbi:MAG: sodium-dependent transporter [Leptospira sp.]|nr:sodium-dependent transporter [Leptospira sp.]